MPERTRDLPADFHLALDARLEADTLIGGEPFAVVRLRPESAAFVRGWRDGAPVGEGGELARALVMANLAQPVPPARSQPVTAVIPVRDRSVTRLLEALDVDEVIVVDDASEDGERLRAEAERAGARYIRHATRRRAGAARNTGLGAASHELVALIDSDCVPRPGWLTPLLAHFADPEVDIVAPRIVPLRRTGYEARHSPLDRGPRPARVLPHGRVSFVPGAALLVRRHLRFDETLRGGEDVDLVWRAGYVRYEPRGEVAHAHRTRPGAWLRRRVYYGRTAAPLAKRHPGNARPLHISPWTTAAYVALARRRPLTALAITALATTLFARDVKPRTAAELVGVGTLASATVVREALTRHWWPLALLTRPARFALMITPPLKLADDLAYGLGLWIGCVQHRTLDPLLPARPWSVTKREL